MTAESNPILAWGLIALTTGLAALIVGVIRLDTAREAFSAPLATR